MGGRSAGQFAQQLSEPAVRERFHTALVQVDLFDILECFLWIKVRVPNYPSHDGAYAAVDACVAVHVNGVFGRVAQLHLEQVAGFRKYFFEFVFRHALRVVGAHERAVRCTCVPLHVIRRLGCGDSKDGNLARLLFCAVDAGQVEFLMNIAKPRKAAVMPRLLRFRMPWPLAF